MRFVALLVLTLPVTAYAGGLARPNVFSALGIGIGGAGFAGVSNPTTIHYNPAGLILMRETVVLGGLEIIAAPRSYTPLSGAREETVGGVSPVPSLGVSTRLAHRGGKGALPLAMGLGFYNSFGGAVEFDDAAVTPGITRSSSVMLELVPSLAYQVTSQLSLGVGLRVGFGLFDLKNTEREGVTRAPSELSGSGVRVGFKGGLTYSPLRWLRLGVVYASPMEVEMKGEGHVEVNPGQPRPDNVTLTMPWPQWAALGGALLLDPVTVYVGVRWIDWSSFQRVVLDLSVINDVVEELDFHDGVSTHLGAEWRVMERLTLLGGFSFDSNTIPDKSVERQYFDAPKVTCAVGGSVRVWSTLVVDLAYEILLGPEREVPERSGTRHDAAGKPVEVELNAAPGTYSSVIHSLGLSVRYSY
jgi:long-chain fatty acid transport protein